MGDLFLFNVGPYGQLVIVNYSSAVGEQNDLGVSLSDLHASQAPRSAMRA